MDWNLPEGPAGMIYDSTTNNINENSPQKSSPSTWSTSSRSKATMAANTDASTGNRSRPDGSAPKQNDPVVRGHLEASFEAQRSEITAATITSTQSLLAKYDDFQKAKFAKVDLQIAAHEQQNDAQQAEIDELKRSIIVNVNRES